MRVDWRADESLLLGGNENGVESVMAALSERVRDE